MLRAPMTLEARYAALVRKRKPWAPTDAKTFAVLCALMDEWPLRARGAWKFRTRP